MRLGYLLALADQLFELPSSELMAQFQESIVLCRIVAAFSHLEAGGTVTATLLGLALRVDLRCFHRVEKKNSS